MVCHQPQHCCGPGWHGCPWRRRVRYKGLVLGVVVAMMNLTLFRFLSEKLDPYNRSTPHSPLCPTKPSGPWGRTPWRVVEVCWGIRGANGPAKGRHPDRRCSTTMQKSPATTPWATRQAVMLSYSV